MDNIDFASLPDAEAARLMAEKDGLSPRPYTTSLDAAVAWLGRMGLEWRRTFDVEERVYCIEVYDSIVWRACEESPDCPTARALCNAGWAAVQAREAGKS